MNSFIFLELPHTFDGYSSNTKFTYEHETTDNIMDYSHNIVLQRTPDLVYFQRKSLYHWQWQILNLKLR